MKSNLPDKTLEEILRGQFKNYELKPSDGLWSSLSRRLRFREFIRFNPGKFNVYYLGVLVTAASLLIIKPGSDPGVIIPQIDNSTQIVDVNEISQPLAKEETRELSRGSAAASKKITTVEISHKTQQDSEITAGEKVDSIKAELLSVKSKEIDTSKSIGEKTIEPDKLIMPAPVADFITDVSKGCVPLKITFNNLSSDFDSLVWEFGDGGYSYTSEPVWIFDEAGSFDIRLIVFGSDGKIAEYSRSIDVYPQPLARFEVNSTDPMVTDEQLVFHNYSENSISWQWDFGDGETSADFEPVHIYQRFDSYSVRLIAKSAYGCIDSLVITNAFGANSCFLKFPNVFLQNNGGPTGGYYSGRTDIEDEIFHPVSSGVTEYNLRIYTRSGRQVFETSDINVGWDGYYQGQKADPGVYIWKVRGVFKNGDPFVQGGDVTLIPRK